MYDPLFIPSVENKLSPLNDVKFGINYSDDYRTPNDPMSDPLHIYDYTEIFFLVSGKASFLINNRLYRVDEGAAIISRAKEVHMCVLDKACRFEHFCLWISAKEYSSLLAPFYEAHFSPVVTFDETTKKRVISLLYSLKELADRDDSVLERTISFLQILSLLQKQGTYVGNKMFVPPELQRILSDIDRRFTNIYSVKDFLSSQFINQATLNRWFRKYLRLSPHKYIESKKLAYAMELLSHGASVTDAATEAGFSDCSHFIALFRKKFGETPLHYKKNLTHKP